MVKKAIAIGAAGLMLLSVAGPAFGWYLFSKDVAIVENSATAMSYTGGNTQNASAAHIFSDVNAGGSRYINTGDAGAYAGALVVANTHIGCDGCGFEGVYHKDFALVRNDAFAMSDTGLNRQDVSGSWGDVNAGGSRTIYTGDADSTARAWTIVNTHWGD